MIKRFRWLQWRTFLIWCLVIAVAVDQIIYWYPRSVQVGMAVLSISLEFLIQASFMIIQFAALFWFLGRGRVYWIYPGETGATWDDYRGNPQVVDSARHVVTLLQGVREFKEMGGESIRGLLLVGPPGTGKSYLAQVVANQAGVPFCYSSAPSFQNMFFGVSNLKIMGLYRKARKKAQQYGACIVFIDEIDAIGLKRSAGGGGGSLFGAGMGILNELLLQMDPPNMDDGFFQKLLRGLGLRRRKAERPLVLTIGATNLPEALDPALLRPGRFDRQIVVDAPDYQGRVDVLEYYLSKVKRAPDIDPRRMALDTVGYTPAQIKHVVNESVILAHQMGCRDVAYRQFRMALEAYEWGLRQPIRSMPEAERRRVAYHEAGHAVAQYLLKPYDPLWKVTIIRHGRALGLSATKPKEERYHHTAEDLHRELRICLAARAAEELFLDEKLGGVTDDLKQATRIAAFYLGAAGMGDELYSYLATDSAPESVRALRPKINKLLESQMSEVRRLLAQNSRLVHAVAQGLLERDELTGEDVEEIHRRITLEVTAT